MLKLLSPLDGESVSLANEEITKWAAEYKPRCLGDNYRKSDHYEGKNVLFAWESNVRADRYILKIKEAAEGAKEQRFEVFQTSFEAEGLNVNADYVWSVQAIAKGKAVAKGDGRFSTRKTPKFLKIEGVSNFRDIAFFSKSLKQGMIFRSAALEEASERGLAEIQALNIRTDLDLRSAGEGLAGTRSPVQGANYFSYPGSYYVDSPAKLTDPLYQTNMAKAFEVFADEKNYPVLFHCAIGRDRTGTLAAVLEAFLNASREDILMDYEASFFSEAGCKDNSSPEYLVGKISEVCDYLSSYAKGSLAENAERFLLDIGVKKASLEEIKRIMAK